MLRRVPKLPTATLLLLAWSACVLDWDKLDPDNAAAGGAGDGGDEGGAPGCTPGEEVSCYTGPDETQGVGVCLPGVATCDDQGQLGACTGEITPAAIDGCNAADDDCNGAIDDGCMCAPGALFDCYEGPMGSDDVGLCHGGQQMCQPDGMSVTACLGQVVPTLEECVNVHDEDCDDASNEGCPTWAARYDGGGDIYAWGMRTLADGTTVSVGYTDGNVSFGGPALTVAGLYDAFVVKISGSGTHLMSRMFGGAGEDVFEDVAIDGAGDLYVVGSITAAVDFGGAVGIVTPAGARDTVILKLDGDTGDAVWRVQLPSTLAGYVVGHGIDVDAAGNSVVTGYFLDTIDFGAGTISSSSDDGFLVRIDSAGAVGFNDTFGEADDDAGLRVRFENGNIILVGYYDEGLDFGGTALGDADSADAFVAKLSSTNVQQWIVPVGEVDDQSFWEMAIDGTDVIAGGIGAGTIDFFDGQPATTADGDDSIIVKLDQNGQQVWAKHYPGPDIQFLNAVTADPNGDVWFTVSQYNVVDYGGFEVISIGNDDVALVKLDGATGDTLRAHRFGDSADEDIRGLGCDASGNLFAVGEDEYDIDFGNGMLLSSSGGTEDLFLVRLPP